MRKNIITDQEKANLPAHKNKIYLIGISFYFTKIIENNAEPLYISHMF